jgi:F0F1-type ATP synthase assembly protein I
MKKINLESLAPKILGLLLVILITLKLIGFITWSWWWVTSPLWGGFALAILLMLFAVIIIAFQKSKSKFKK